MKHVHLFQNDPVEARERIRELRTFGYKVTYGAIRQTVLKKVREQPPAAVLIDLSRAPSMGRDVGIYIRYYKSTRNVPIVFVGGKLEKIKKVKRQLPDAVYTEWCDIKHALKQAIAHPPKNPTAPTSALAGYSSTPLVKKLGIKADSVVLLISAPDDFDRKFEKLPRGVTIRRRLSSNCDLIIWFVKSEKVLNKNIKKMRAYVGKDGMWIVWPKRGRKVRSDLSQRIVRKTGLGSGLVDYKVCAVDSVWTGLKFAIRKAK